MAANFEGSLVLSISMDNDIERSFDDYGSKSFTIELKDVYDEFPSYDDFTVNVIALIKGMADKANVTFEDMYVDGLDSHENDHLDAPFVEFGKGLMPLLNVAHWAYMRDTYDDDQILALFEYLSNNSYELSRYDDSDEIESWFDEHYRGCWDSEGDFAFEYLEESGMLPEPGSIAYSVCENNSQELWDHLSSDFESFSYSWGRTFIFSTY